MVNTAGNSLAAIVVKIIQSPVGIMDIDKEKISLYPNPAQSFVILPDEWIGKKIDIYSLDGRLVKSLKISFKVFTIDDLPDGNYFIKCGAQFSSLIILRN